MQSSPLTKIEAATPDWVTATLQAHGALTSGEVCAVQAEQGSSPNATNARLHLTYTPNAQGECPPTLFLKICPNQNPHFGDTEITYYTAVTAEMPDPPVPHRYHHAYDNTTGAYHLLLQDLSETHANNWGVPPTWERAAGMMEALANLHAYWWNHPRLRETAGVYADVQHIETYVATPEHGLEPMAQAMAGELTTTQSDFIRHVFAQHRLRMAERAQETHTLTCIHGDPNPGNVLSPHQPDGKTYLIDRQLFSWSLGGWIGANDVSSCMVLWWEPAQRRALETALLEHYHTELLRRGVQNYSLSQLWQDYRLTAMQSLYVAIDWCSDPEELRECGWIWRPMLHKALAACEDLRCAELL